jgi:predicted nucleic acid-binding protein
MGNIAVRVKYLDASVLVKLVADDSSEIPGRNALRELYNNQTNFMTTSYCLSEAISVFKVKYLYRKQIDEQEYLKNINNFVKNIVGGKLEIDEMPLLAPILLIEAEKLIKKYKIDFIDSIQIITILHGKYFRLCGDSKSLLITADDGLAKAARAEGARVWHCINEPVP